MARDEESAARIAELAADNERLRRLLDQRDAPRQLRHQLRNTVATLRTIIRRSAVTRRDLDDYVSQLEDRLDALARAQATSDIRASVDLQALVADELLRCGVPEGERAVLRGPEIELTPSAGQVFALAIHELAINAVEHGAMGADEGRLEVEWEISEAEPDPILTFSWREFCTDCAAPSSHQGFGTEVLKRMLAYELSAQTTLSLEPDGLRCVIRLPFVARVGRAG